MAAYKQLKLLSVDKTYKLELGKLMYKSVNNLLPTTIGNFFEFSSQEITHGHFVRNRQRPVRLLCSSRTGEKSVQYKSFKLWNELTFEIKNSDSLAIFKRKYKEYLIDH